MDIYVRERRNDKHCQDDDDDDINVSIYRSYDWSILIFSIPFFFSNKRINDGK